MQNLIYKGIVFDEYAQDPYGAIWAEIIGNINDNPELLKTEE